jgi:hypothetical protein
VQQVLHCVAHGNADDNKYIEYSEYSSTTLNDANPAFLCERGIFVLLLYENPAFLGERGIFVLLLSEISIGIIRVRYILGGDNAFIVF